PVLAPLPVHRQRLPLPRRPQPVGRLLRQRLRAGVLAQPLAPLPIGGGPPRQGHRLPPPQLLARPLQVLQQHPPRHPVHRQVVHHQLQPPGTLSLPRLPQPPQQRPPLQVQAPLHPLRRLLPRPLHPPQPLPLLLLRVPTPPPTGHPPPPHPHPVPARHQRQHRPRQRPR